MWLSVRTAIILIFCISLPGFAQMDTVSPVRRQTSIDGHYLKSYLTDSRDIVISPFRWNRYQWAVVTAVAGGTVFLFTQDEIIQRWIQDHRTFSMDRASRFFFEPFGSGLYTLPALGILYGCGLIWKDERARLTSLKGVEAFILAGIASEIIKHLTHRHRPSQDDPPDPMEWEGPFSGFKYTSFPSGHAATAFAVATVVGLSYRNTVWIPVLCYSIATGVALSRVYDNDHWASDVLFGSALGFAIGKLVLRNERKLNVFPVSQNGPGITLVYRF